MFWIFGVGMVALAVALLDAQVTKSKFSCDGRTSGYYADVVSGCQVYHMCDGLGRQFSYTCPNATLFQQRMLICDHWYMVNCSKSEGDYAANLRIGQREMPFVDDSESNPYHRTPRPDLLSHPSQSEYDIIYRTGKAYLGNNLNLVGVESDSKNSTTSTTDKPAYSLPSHWSTEYSGQQTTYKPAVKEKVTNSGNKKNFENSGTIKGKPIVTFNAATEPPAVNYKSYFKNTTPVFPKTVDVTTETPDDFGLIPPLPYQLSNGTDSKDGTANKDAVVIPPLPYQLSNSADSKDGTANKDAVEVVSTAVPVNFKSEFKATTPVYPKTVDVTSEEPGDLGVLPPIDPNDSKSDTGNTLPLSINLEIEPPLVGTNPEPHNKSQVNIKISSPSKFYQPPKFEPDYTDDSTDSINKKQGGFKSLNSNEWEDLRKKFLIPDYEFPLESVSRPSYDSVLSSFRVSPGLPPPEK